MSDTAFLLAPAYILFFLGMLLRRTGILDKGCAWLLFRLVYALSIPVMALLIFPYINLATEMATVALVSLVAGAAIPAAAAGAAKLLRMPEETAIALFRGSLGANTGLLIPFILPLYGDEGVALLFLFWCAGAIAAEISLRIVPPLKQIPGSEGKSMHAFLLPALIAILCGLAMNLLDLRFDPVTAAAMHDIGKLGVPLLLLASGASVTIPKARWQHLVVAIMIRMAGGASIALFFALLTGLGETARIIAVLCAAAPAGLPQSGSPQQENLNGGFAEAYASASMLAGLILFPLLLFIL